MSTFWKTHGGLQETMKWVTSFQTYCFHLHIAVLQYEKNEQFDRNWLKNKVIVFWYQILLIFKSAYKNRDSIETQRETYLRIIVCTFKSIIFNMLINLKNKSIINEVLMLNITYSCVNLFPMKHKNTFVSKWWICCIFGKILGNSFYRRDRYFDVMHISRPWLLSLVKRENLKIKPISAFASDTILETCLIFNCYPNLSLSSLYFFID